MTRPYPNLPHLNEGDTEPRALISHNPFFLERRIRRQIGSMTDDIFFAVTEHFGLSSEVQAGDITDEDMEKLSNSAHQLHDLVLEVLKRKVQK